MRYHDLMAATATTRLALKEWAVVIQALHGGRQVLRLRKGGIHGPHDRLAASPAEFFFFPGYEHQRRELLKPEDAARYEPLLDPAREAAPLRVDTFARLAAELAVDPP